MMVMKKYSEAVSQQRIVGNGSLKELFLHVTRQVRPQFECRVTQQQFKPVGQIIHMAPVIACQVNGVRTFVAAS
jgi:hypothetical protein